MSKTSLKSLLAASAFLASSAAAGVQAQEATMAQVNQYAAEGAAMGQVTSVSQLRDVRPTDWAFQALQSLVERYGCIAGYPDGTYRGNRAMTRYEFAAGLNACLDRVNELIASATADLVTQEDLAVLQRLQEEFQAELATLRGRVDALEARTSELEANQFSTTTTLAGEAVFDLGSAFDGEVNGDPVDDDVTFGSDVTLTLNTSFTGRDLLTMDLNAGNIQGYGDRTGAPETAVDYEGDTGNDFVLDNLWYNFPVGNFSAYVGTVDLEADEIAPTTASLMDDAIGDYFGNGNPLSYSLVDGAGAGFNYQLGNNLNIAAAYLGEDDGNSSSAAGRRSGLFSGSNTSFAQLTFTPGDKLTIAGTYNRAYLGEGGGIADGNNAYTVNAFGVNAGYALASKLNLSGWAGWGFAEAISGGDDADLFNWAVQLGLPDLFREGNFGGVSVGGFTNVEASDSATNTTFTDTEDTPFLAQAFYRMQLSDNVSIQPGVFYIANPGGDDDNDNVWIGSLRTKFSF